MVKLSETYFFIIIPHLEVRDEGLAFWMECFNIFSGDVKVERKNFLYILDNKGHNNQEEKYSKEVDDDFGNKKVQ